MSKKYAMIARRDEDVNARAETRVFPLKEVFKMDRRISVENCNIFLR